MRLMVAGLLILFSAFSFGQSFGTATKDPFGSSTEVEYLPVSEAYGVEVEVLSERSLRLFWSIAPE